MTAGWVQLLTGGWRLDLPLVVVMVEQVGERWRFRIYDHGRNVLAQSRRTEPTAEGAQRAALERLRVAYQRQLRQVEKLLAQPSSVPKS